MASDEIVLEMREISKAFNGVTVLNKVNFSLAKGEIVGLVGENGAGKSTLMKILSGVYTKDAGEIFLDGKPIELNSAADSQKLGIRIIYQELSLFGHLNSAENIFIHDELQKGPLLDKAAMEARTNAVLRDVLHVEVDIKRPVSQLLMAQRQMIEIARAVNADAKIIIMDEPTTTLETKEKEQLFRVMRDLSAQGKSIIFISHHLDEVISVCHRVVSLRDGVNSLNKSTNELSIEDIISAMIGKNVTNRFPKAEEKLGENILKVDALNSKNAYQNISFELRRGEILGVVGLVGCGKTEMVRTLFGLHASDSGTITLEGKSVQLKNIYQAKSHGIAFLPSDRRTEGIFPIQTTAWNVSIASLESVSHGKLLSNRSEYEATKAAIRDFGIKVNSPKQKITHLSGGNQQKVMLARWMRTDPKLLLLEEPTHGIDINAKTEVYQLIAQYVLRGNSVIIVSSEEEEVLGICDRVIIMRNGRIRKMLDAKATSLEEVKYYTMNDEDETDNEKRN